MMDSYTELRTSHEDMERRHNPMVSLKGNCDIQATLCTHGEGIHEACCGVQVCEKKPKKGESVYDLFKI